MLHILANVTWRCNNNCPECWVRRSVGLNRDMMMSEELAYDEWVEILNRLNPDIVDIAGGEPSLYSGTEKIIMSLGDIRFGLSTNGLYKPFIDSLVRRQPLLKNIVSINMSFHPNTREWFDGDYDLYYAETVANLREAGYNVSSSVVDYGDNVNNSRKMINLMRAIGIHVSISPYEDMSVVENGEKTLCCDAGKNHLVISPDGMVWPCLTRLRSKYANKYIIGNVYGVPHSVSAGISNCNLYCYDYYVLRTQHEAGDMWGVNAREC